MSCMLFISSPPYNGTFQTALVMDPARPHSESYLVAFIDALRRSLLNCKVKRAGSWQGAEGLG